MSKPKISTRKFIDGVNDFIENQNPKDRTVTCTECDEDYVAGDMADYFICPLCGKTIKDEEEDLED